MKTELNINFYLCFLVISNFRKTRWLNKKNTTSINNINNRLNSLIHRSLFIHTSFVVSSLFLRFKLTSNLPLIRS